MIIGIPKYKDNESYDAMMNSLIDSADISGDTIILIESFDDQKEVEIEEWDLLYGSKGSILIKTPKEGPWEAYNRLFDIAIERKEDLFLTQTDVLFPKCYKRDWLENMKQVAQIPECGIITCYGGGGQSGPDFIDGFEWVGAWCTYIPYRTLKKIGGYDKNIVRGYGVDIDYTYAIQQAGLKVYYVNYWVDHHPEYQIAHEHEKVDNFEEQKQKAFKYMRKKWGIKNELDR